MLILRRLACYNSHVNDGVFVRVDNLTAPINYSLRLTVKPSNYASRINNLATLLTWPEVPLLKLRPRAPHTHRQRPISASNAPPSLPSTRPPPPANPAPAASA